MKTKDYPSKFQASIMPVLAVVGILACGQSARAQAVPVISNVSPNGAVQFQPSATLSFNASSSAGIAPSAISVQLTGTSLPGQTFATTLTTANGLIVTGTSTSRSVSAPLASNTIYTAVIQVTDANENTASSTVSFDTINPAYTFEAEDFDYTGGQFFDNPQTNKYSGLNVTYGVDAQNGNFGGGGSAYRPSGLNTQVNGDKLRVQYNTGLQDYNVGWNNGGSGNWGNYTRTFPAGTFNVYMRAANPNSFTTDAASMALVTSGRGTTSQTTTNLGTFAVPNTGNWQIYTWVPLRDANGNLVQFTGGSLETLRVTTDGGSYNANFYLLMPADTNPPAISNLYPDGSSFFQYTNALSFIASASAGITTNSIVVTLDGVNVSGLAFSGSPTSWNVSCPLQVNTNHTAVIMVTANNGNVATRTVRFNDFQSTDYQWEAEDYDYTSNGVGGQFFDNPQTNAYFGLPSKPGVDNHQFDLNANTFAYRTNSLGPCPSTTPVGDGQRPQFVGGKTDYNIGNFGGGSWVNYTRHYPAGTYYVWGRFAEGAASVTEATLSQLTNGYGTASQTVNLIGTFFIPPSGGGSTWEWSPLEDDNGNLLKVGFDGSQNTLQLGGSPVGGQPEVNVNFLMLVPTTPDPFVVVQTLNLGTTNVQIVYSKPVEAASATNIANYVFTNGLAVSGASLSPDYVTVILTTAPLVYGSNYSIVINGVRDRMNFPNTIATNTTVNFSALPYTLYDIGNPSVISTATVAGNGINVTAVGSDFGGNSDQGNFSYQIYSGNFDVSVRLAGLGLSDIFAKAGLMARETLDPGSRFAASIATPAMNGCFFEWRDPAGNASGSAGNFPANYPNTWLRLQRAGNTFTGYAGYDGRTWTPLGSATITMSNQVYLGFLVSSHSTNQVSTAQFRDVSNVTNAIVGTIVNPHDAIGPSSRKTPIVFSEIMYKPAPRTDGNNIEFIELYNSNPWFQDISGYQITCADMNYTFPPNTTIPGGGYLVVAAAPADIESVYGITNVMGPYTGSLKKAETLELFDEQGAVLLTVPYSNVYPWPVATDGTGHSIVLANPTYGEGDPRAWDISDVVGGSPGQMEAFRPSPLRNVVINEFLAHTDPPDYDYIELYNHSTNSVDISGCILTDDPATNKFVIPPGTVISARGFVYYSETNMNFALSAAGETIYFKNPDQTRVLDAVQFDGQENGVATGRWPDGANQFYRLRARTPGTNNAAVLINCVVINELMYDPISENDDDQYVELYNRGTNTVNLGGWQLSDAISFTFPSNVVLAPDGYLVVARNAAQLRANYANLNLINCIGDFSGKLSHNGEHLALTMSDTIISTNSQGVVSTNTIHITVNDLTYGTGGRWGQWAAGGGSSLELIDPDANPRLAANWADSDETQKSSWVNIEATGVLDNGQNYGSSIGYAQIGLLDVGECLVDNVEVRPGTAGANYVSNPDFESGLSNWSLQGCHSRSSRENTGYASSYSLHIRNSDAMWTGVNSCQVSLTNTSLASGQTATLRFKARWLHGWPEVLLRLNGNWLEATGTIPVPTNLGTPGARNSRYLANTGPAIYEVTHTPSVPAASQAVVVTARVHDPDGVQSLTLNYRLDPGTTYTAVTMKDDGTGGDAIAADGVFSGTIPGQATGQIVAFYISATDTLSAATRFPALLNDNAPVRECVVMFGDSNPAGSFAVYHLWITQTNVTRWINLSDLSNEGNDCTIVTGNRTVYNAQARFTGSPWHQIFDSPYGGPCHYRWTFPDDDLLLGTTSFDKVHQPGNYPGDDPTLQREQTAYTFFRTLGQPWLYRRYIAVYVNGNRRGTLMEDTQKPDGDMIKEHFPNDTDGYLYKMQQWMEFAPFPSGTTIAFSSVGGATLMPYTTTGGAKKLARYRYIYLMRRTPDSFNNYTNVFSLVDAASSSGTANYVANMENMADMENWMRVFAANHAAGNWDCFGGTSGQNLYGYISTHGTKYSLLMYDFNMVLGNSQASGPGQGLFDLNGQDPNLTTIYNTPDFRRMYWRALKELVDGPLDVSQSGPLLDAKYKVFAANGLGVTNPDGIKTWLSQARSSIASQIAAEDAPNFTVNPTVLITNNLGYVTGTAPVTVTTIWFNGIAWPVTWTSVTGWAVQVPLQPGSNPFSVVGVDIYGQPVPGASNNITAVYPGTVPSAAGQVVINEIMYNPATPDAGYLELYNTSSNITFDLSGWEIHGLSYTFPNGSLLLPGKFLVLAANRAAFAGAYGATVPVFDAFTGTLQIDGETLALFKPGTNAANDLVVAKVRYESVAPWPATNGTGSSIQLMDSRQDNWRVGNWAATTSPQWVYVATTGTASTSTLYVYLQSTGDVYIDDIKLVAGADPEAETNVLPDGDFESGFPGPWTVSANLAGSSLSTSTRHSGNASLHVVAFSGGSSQATSIYQSISPALVTNQTYTLSFWYLQSTNGGPLTMRLSGSGILANVNPAPPSGLNLTTPTPGTTNSVAMTLPAFPPLWLNELQAENLTGITNSAGQRTAWLELYNPSTNVVSLNGLYLANTYGNLTNWAFPSGAVINPGQFKVIFADGLTNLSTLAELHTRFILPGGVGSLALSRIYNGQPQVLDYMNYSGLGANHSYGSFPDGQSFDRQEFFYVTPGGTNNGTSALLNVFINEWMADNTVTLSDPADNDYEDWFEIYNPGTNSVDLGGYYLTDTLTNKFQYQIPNNGHYLVPPHGYLLVWADNETNQNKTNRADLHANFKLDKAGEAIGLFSADGTAIDAVLFGPQTTDVSEGRFPDGAASIFRMTITTPRAANILSNVPPTLAAISDKVLTLGQSLTFTASATDSNQPPQALTFSLAPGAPAGAGINAVTGQFSWTPATAPSTNLISVIVTDSGGMSASQTFTVVVVLPPHLVAAGANGSHFTLSWQTVAGLNYQIEYNDDLNASSWTPLGSPIPGTGGTIIVTNDVSLTKQRFFRIMLQ